MSSRTEITAKVIAGETKQTFREYLRSRLGRLERFATKNDLYLALTVRDPLFERTARMGKFSSDRSIRDYCERVWKIKRGRSL